jgi:hypothetical protein
LQQEDRPDCVEVAAGFILLLQQSRTHSIDVEQFQRAHRDEHDGKNPEIMRGEEVRHHQCARQGQKLFKDSQDKHPGCSAGRPPHEWLLRQREEFPQFGASHKVAPALARMTGDCLCYLLYSLCLSWSHGMEGFPVPAPAQPVRSLKFSLKVS